VTLLMEIEGLELFGYHGVLDDERRDGQRFLVDLELEPSATTAAETDDLFDAIDYRDIVAIVREVSEGRAFHLLEAFGAALADALLTRLPLARVRVRVRKPDVLLGLPVTHTAVSVERHATTRSPG
jgi:dihydroneopterin aldolase